MILQLTLTRGLSCLNKEVLEMNTVFSLVKKALLGLGLLATASLTSCNTVNGLGRDIENAGNSLYNATHHQHSSY